METNTESLHLFPGWKCELNRLEFIRVQSTNRWVLFFWRSNLQLGSATLNFGLPSTVSRLSKGPPGVLFPKGILWRRPATSRRQTPPHAMPPQRAKVILTPGLRWAGRWLRTKKGKGSLNSRMEMICNGVEMVVKHDAMTLE